MQWNTANKFPKKILYKSLKVNEIFYSIQGESTLAGIPCIFIRLSHCNLRCSYCDTEYAFYEGYDNTIKQILEQVESFNCNVVEITGGEPLLQKNVYPLLTALCDLDLQVLLETGGHMEIQDVDQRVKIIMDIKCPSSGESEKNLWSNIEKLKSIDEIKFVIGDKKDFNWAKSIIEKYELNRKCALIFAPVFGKMNNKQLAEGILKDHLPVRLQLQLHKYIWSPDERGV